MAIFAVILVSLASVLASACAINFFWRTGIKKAAGIASFFVAIFLVFWASGLWQENTPRAMGSLVPLFVIILGIGWLVVLIALKVYFRHKKTGGADQDE